MGNYRAEVEKTAPQNDPVEDVENQEFSENLNSGIGEEDPDIVLKRKSRRNRRKICAAGMALLLILLAGLGSACLFKNPTVFTYPLHASCKINWTFSKSCPDVKSMLINQIEAWKTNETCGTGQKCLYKLVSDDGNVLQATHTTPVKHYIDDMKYTFYSNSETKGCNVEGFSTSRTWYAVLDYGTNYCNIHNLVEGAGLQQDRLYSELTRDEICTQYTSSNCEKY